MGLVICLLFSHLITENKKFDFSLKIITDSELVKKQMSGEYNVKKPHISIFYRMAKFLLKKIQNKNRPDPPVTHVFRNFNKTADKIATESKLLAHNSLLIYY